MKRRNAIKNIMLASGSFIVLPAWMQSCGVNDKGVHLSSFSVDEQGLIASIADTIIPAGNSTGALSVGTDKYLQKLFDDCYDAGAQNNIKKQLHALDAAAKAAYGDHFTACTQKQRQEALLKFSVSTVKDEKAFFDVMKTETIRGFATSQKVMEGYLLIV